MEDISRNLPLADRSGSAWPRLIAALLLVGLITGIVSQNSEPVVERDPPPEVLASERYGHVSRMAEEMEALIGQIEALSTGAPASGSHP